MYSKILRKIICTVLCLGVVFTSLVFSSASENSGNSLAPGEAPLNKEQFSAFVKQLVLSKQPELASQINNANWRVSLRSINDVNVDIESGKVFLNATFGYKYELWLIRGTEVGTGDMEFDLLTSDDNSIYGVRFNGFYNLHFSGAIAEAARGAIRSRVNDELAGDCYWFGGDPGQSFKILNSGNLPDVLNYQIQKVLEDKRISEVPFEFLGQPAIAVITLHDASIKAFDIVTEGNTLIGIDVELGIRAVDDPNTVQLLRGKLEFKYDLIRKAADNSLWGRFNKVENIEFDGLDDYSKQILISVINENLKNEIKLYQ